jgi:hypothetical protein
MSIAEIAYEVHVIRGLRVLLMSLPKQLRLGGINESLS